jgi:hypothetical protein
MATKTYSTVQLGTEGSTPQLALSILRRRIKAVERRSEDGIVQVGIADNFQLHDAGGSIVLVCRVELDAETLGDTDKPEWAGLFVADHPLMGDVDE